MEDAVNANAWRVTLAAAALTALVAGGRSAFGLFVTPLNTASGIGLASLSLAIAGGQLALGLLQPVIGAIVDRHGARRVIALGALALALATALPALWPVPWVVAVSMVAVAVAGSTVGSNGLLIGEIGRAVSPARTGFAIGLLGAGASAGPMLLGPLTQFAVDLHGWAWALLATAVLSLVAWPLAAVLPPRTPRAPQTTSQPLADVLREWRFWRVAAGFGVCGFHVAFLAAHMPGVIERCGLPPSLAGLWIGVAGAGNLVGSVLMGAALRRGEPAALLAGMYLLRAASITLLLVLPATVEVMLGFAVLMGASHMATLPPTSALVARQHGVARLGTLFGFVMLVHQVGAFAGVAFGGWAAARTGSDTLLWTVDLALAIGAAALAWGSRPAAQAAATSQRTTAARRLVASIGLASTARTPARRSAS
jgi:predicted MFS family arabinose efflux permease